VNDNSWLTWKITAVTPFTMDISLKFREPLAVSSEGMDQISVTFNDTGLLFDQSGNEVARGFVTNTKFVPKQYGSGLDAAIAKFIKSIGAPIEMTDPKQKFFINVLIAASLQQILSPVTSQKTLILIPFCDISMPTNVEDVFNVLLQINAFEAIPTQSFFSEMEVALDHIAIDPRAEQYEDLGFNGAWLLINLGSTLVIFSMIIVATMLSFCLPKHLPCCPQLRKLRKGCRSTLIFSYPMQQFKESYVVFVLAALLNIVSVKWAEAKDTPEAKINLVLAYVLVAAVSVYPAL